MTKFTRRAAGKAASLKKCTQKPSAVNARPAAADNYPAVRSRICGCGVPSIALGFGSREIQPVTPALLQWRPLPCQR